MMRRFRARDGFTLIEIMVATLLLLVAMAGFVPFFLQGLNQSSSARYRSVATNIARERMEQVRQLDYREITTNLIEQSKPLADRLKTLEDRFGTNGVVTDVMRGTTFTTHYTVSTIPNGLKNVTVMVDWVAPPKVSSISVTTLIHQQFLGPRGSRLTVELTVPDDLGSPFRLVDGSVTRTIKYYIAEADWGLIYPIPSTSPDSAAYDVYARMVLVDDNGFGIALGDPANDYKISKAQLHRTWDTNGILTEVYFELSGATGVNPAIIPDGYWELQAAAYNQYDEPGNLWRLRIRRESGAPAAPAPFTAVGQADGTIELTWTPGSERDRDHFVLQWRTSTDGITWPGFTTLVDPLDPAATSYTHGGGDPTVPLHPWGDIDNTNYYEYNLFAVDFASPANTGAASTAIGQLPPLPTTTTTLPPGVTTTAPPPTTSSTTSTTVSTTTTTLLYSVSIENRSSETRTIKIEKSGSDPVYETSKKNKTLTVTGLAAGVYSITASLAGQPDVVGSFTLPAQASTVVLYILLPR